jgi:Tfp pilus assembly protein PilV
MGKLRHNQKGFAVVEILLALIFVAIVVFIGMYVAHNRSTKTSAANATTNAETSTTAKKTTPAPDPTADWTSYTSTLGKFSLKYPTSWVTTTNPDLCANTDRTGLFMLGVNSDSVGRCASENIGQMYVTWGTERSSCGGLSGDAWRQDSKKTVTVGGVSATKIEATAKDQGAGLGAYPEGTKTVQYCVVANNKTYIADYTQLSSYPDALSDFNLMVTKTLKFN